MSKVKLWFVWKIFADISYFFIILSYNLQGRIGPRVERTQWNSIQFNPDMSKQNVFCRSANEPLRILHEDKVHYTKLIWMPENDVTSPLPGNDTATPLPQSSNTTPLQGNG